MGNRWIRFISSLVIGLVSSLAVYSQPSVSSNVSSQTSGQDVIAPGTMLQVEITAAIDAKKAHAGDLFRARLWADVHQGDKVILPQKTMLVGHVVDAQPRSETSPESRLTIAFDKAVLKDGSELPLHGVVESVELSAMAAAAA